MKKKILIEGMSCGHCVGHVTQALKEVSGVIGVDVNLTEKNAMVELSNEVQDEDLKVAIEDAGYKVINIK